MIYIRKGKGFIWVNGIWAKRFCANFNKIHNFHKQNQSIMSYNFKFECCCRCRNSLGVCYYRVSFTLCEYQVFFICLLVSSSMASPKMIKSRSQTSANPKLIVSSTNSKLLVSSTEPMWNSKISVEGSKLCPIKAGMRTPDLSIRSSKNLGGKKVPLNYRLKKENVEADSLSSLETVHPVSSNEKRLPSNLTLKRKTLELSTAELALATLKPLKRLSKSSSKSSDVKKSSVRALEEKVDDKIISTCKDCPSSTLASPQEIEMMEIEISTVMQNDGIMKKAEAYTKELENICNMLRKKQEEAKELLVRAVVNNNYLLMLNHPIYEEKICKVQDFAAELMSKCSLTRDGKD